MTIPRRQISRILTLLLLLYAAALVFRIDLPAQPAPEQAAEQAGWYAAYFTNPQFGAGANLSGGPDEVLAAAIDAADQSVDLAVYELELWSVTDALVRAHSRGVTVRLVTESDNLGQTEIQSLEAAGIQVRGDERDPLMHDKFVIIDGAELWTGSMNLTVGSAYRSNNNLLRVSSTWLAEQYRREFEEMFVLDMFGALSLPELEIPGSLIEGVRVEVRFSPDDRVAERIVELIGGAQRSIQIMAYNLTLDEISDAILDRAQAGVLVQGVFDKGQAKNQGSDVERLAQAGLDVWLDGSPGLMHHKVIVIDGELLITGSYNFSRSAEERNDENVLFLFSPELADQYRLEFERVLAEARG
ncbi:MAG: phospholipase D-like domain-containing protein [Anaerolineales bacterium]